MKCYQNHLFSSVSEKAGWLLVFSLIAYVMVASVFYASPSYAQRYQTEYSKLLESCSAAIDESGYGDAHKELTRKIYSGRNYKLWIDVTVGEDGAEAKPYRAYCEGLKSSGKIEVFAMSDGAWKNGSWTADTQVVLQEAVANK